MQESKSEVAQFRQRQALEEQAAQSGLLGLAIVASHEAITARMEIGAERILQLLQEGKHEEAKCLMETPTWGVEVSSSDQTTTRPSAEGSQKATTVPGNEGVNDEQ